MQIEMQIELYASLERISKTARRGLITVREANQLMFEAIDKAFATETAESYKSKQKAIHKMYMLLFELTKTR